MVFLLEDLQNISRLYIIFLELDDMFFYVHFNIHVTIYLLISKSYLNYLDIISFMFHSFVELFFFDKYSFVELLPFLLYGL